MKKRNLEISNQNYKNNLMLKYNFKQESPDNRKNTMMSRVKEIEESELKK